MHKGYYYYDLMAGIHLFLSLSIAITLANALLSRRFDYCNSLLHGISILELWRLQGFQNTLRRIINRTSRYSIATDHLKTLLWLPVKYRMEFKATKPWLMICHRISVHSLYHIVLLLEQGGVFCQINSWLLMILITGFTNLKCTLFLAFLLLVPGCGIHYPWVQALQTL